MVVQWRIQDFPEEGAPTYDFAKFSQKLHEIERIWVGVGWRIFWTNFSQDDYIGGGGGWLSVLKFGQLKSEVFLFLGGGRALWSEFPERGSLEYLNQNFTHSSKLVNHSSLRCGSRGAPGAWPPLWSNFEAPVKSPNKSLV